MVLACMPWAENTTMQASSGAASRIRPMASSIASTATFVINPGFVYTHGLSGFLHYAVAAQAGVAFGLVAVTKGFRRVGVRDGCLTIPDWIRARYGSERLALFFALINLLSITFVVLIMVG